MKREWTITLHKQQIRSNYCCTDDEVLIRKLFETGVGFILVDRLDASMKVAQAAGIAPLKPVYRRRNGK